MRSLFWMAMLSIACATDANAVLGRYDVAWDTPSADSSGSMPLGNGDIGLNVWVEENGDLLFYISKTDAWDENARLVKLGRVRVKLTPNPFLKGVPFRQVLRLREGVIEIVAGPESAPVKLRVWVDANLPVVRVVVEQKEAFDLSVALEVWRTDERTLGKDEVSSAYGLAEAPYPVTALPDTVVPGRKNQVAWYHRNTRSMWRETLERQGMTEWAKQAADPLLDRTFGGLMEAEGLVSDTATSLKSASPRTGDARFALAIHVLTATAPTPERWMDQLDQLSAKTRGVDEQAAFEAHKQWWDAFWNRSWVHVSGGADAEQVSQAYALQRFISACAGRGAYPIKFNGAIFTVDHSEGKPFDADYRNWGGPYWFQNTRLAYWPMLASGDFEMIRPLFDMFFAALPFAQARTKAYFGHDGAFFPETMCFWGAYAQDNYGWMRAGKPISEIDNKYIRWHWEGQLELLALMLDYYDFTEDTPFVRERLLPLADAILAFFDKHFSRDESGKILFKPAQALETWQNVINPLTEIAGLQFVLDRLLALTADAVMDDQRRTWRRLRDELPPLPVRELEGKKLLSPARDILQDTSNSENPELYAIFPFRLFGVGKPELELAHDTFAARRVKGYRGWQQDDTQAAFLGLTAEARQGVSERFSNKHKGSRFPAFWGPNFDWVPDQDHGCNGLMALQTMLLQTEGKRMLLFPAWPKEWDVDFKLTAPFRTTVEGTYRAGKLERLAVTPPERRQDVEIIGPLDTSRP